MMGWVQWSLISDDMPIEIKCWRKILPREVELNSPYGLRLRKLKIFGFWQLPLKKITTTFSECNSFRDQRKIQYRDTEIHVPLNLSYSSGIWRSNKSVTNWDEEVNCVFHVFNFIFPLNWLLYRKNKIIKTSSLPLEKLNLARININFPPFSLSFAPYEIIFWY